MCPRKELESLIGLLQGSEVGAIILETYDRFAAQCPVASTATIPHPPEPRFSI